MERLKKRREVERAIMRYTTVVIPIGVEMAEYDYYYYRTQRGKRIDYFEVQPPSSDLWNDKYVQVDIPVHGFVVTVHDGESTYQQDLQEKSFDGKGDHLYLEPKSSYRIRKALVRLGIRRKSLTDDQVE